jgi:uncharacterized protein
MNDSSSTLKGAALVTGASKGIGRGIARAFAYRGHPVILVAHDQAELDAVAAQLQQETGVTVRSIAQDLAAPDFVAKLLSAIDSAEVEIDILCNNAGIGQHGKFADIPIERDLEVIRVNVEAPLRLTKALLPRMMMRGRGKILNTASIAAFEPGPTLAVYHASKAFVLSWSEALATELENTGITVTAVCPGPVDTDFFPKADMLQTRAFQQMAVMGPMEVGDAAVEACLKGERVAVPGVANKAIVASSRMMSEHSQARKNEKLYEDLPADKQKRNRGDIEAKEAAKR